MKKYKDMNDLEKAKFIYSAELIGFGVLFIVLGLLKMFAVIGHNDKVFTWITIFGSGWVIFDFVWFLVSKKHRKSSCLLDKLLTLPLSLYIISLDITSFVRNFELSEPHYRYAIASAFCYASAVFIFEGIYHWFHPLQMIIEEVNKERQEKEAEIATETKEEKKED